MKTTVAVFIALITLSFVSIKTETKAIKVSESSIKWVGKKITGQHNGTISLKEGALSFKKNKLVGGSFVVDMTSIEVKDLSGKHKNNLEGHLKSGDFFGTEKFKTASLVFTKVKGKKGKYVVTGDLTIKGITESILFDLTISENTATSSLKVDRTKYGIKYKSSSFFDNLKNKAINNEFELEVVLKF